MLTSTTRIIAAVVAAAVTLPLTAGAVTRTATFDISMKIVADCSISAAAMDFGQSQGMLSTAVTTSSNISVTCTNTTPYNVGLNAGTGTGSSGTTRYMSGTGSSAGAVRFNLYQTPGAGAWGNTQGSDTMSGTGTGSLQTLTVYGEIPAQATPAPDTYKSTVTATVYF